MVSRLVAAGAAKTISTIVPPAIVNQVETSVLLTTSPRLMASSRRRGVGSSVCSVSSRSSAITIAQDGISSGVRRELVQHAPSIIEKHAHHRTQRQYQKKEADQDRQRQRDKEDL